MHTLITFLLSYFQSASSEISELFKGSHSPENVPYNQSPENVPYNQNPETVPYNQSPENDRTSETKSPADTDSDVIAVTEICRRAQNDIENDIESTVSEFLEEFSVCFSTVVTGNAFITRRLQEKLLRVSQWIGRKLQDERDGWANKMKMAMQEIESQRKSALQSLGVIQECSDQLRLLLECFNVSDQLLRSLPTDDQRLTLQKEVEILVDVCNIFMEDRFQCLHIMGMNENTSANLADVLGSLIPKMHEEFKNLEKQSVQLQKTLEAENQQLSKEVVKLKKSLLNKEKDIEMFQDQLKEINEIVYGQDVSVSDASLKATSDSDNEKHQGQGQTQTAPTQKQLQSQSLSKINNLLKQSTSSSQSVKHSKYTSFVKHKMPSNVQYLEPIQTNNPAAVNPPHQTNANPPQQANANVASHQTEVKSQGRITAGTQTSVIQGILPPMIQISEEKLDVLKQRARKLEESLHDAITSMEMLRKTARTKDNPPMTSTSLDLSPLKTARLVKGKKGQLSVDHLNRDWRKATFEVKGAPTATVLAYDVLPKLNKPRDFTKRRCQSEKLPPPAPSDSFRSAADAVTPKDQQADTLAKLRAYHRPKNGFGKVSKCLRCQKLFRTTDNHKLACCFHSKGKERAEKYSDDGRLVKVTYIWKCCNQELDSEGCCTGQHV